MQKYAYLYVLDTLSDWEPAYAIAELNSGRFFKTKGRRLPVKTVGATTDTITTMGGLRIVPVLQFTAITTGIERDFHAFSQRRAYARSTSIDHSLRGNDLMTDIAKEQAWHPER